MNGSIEASRRLRKGHQSLTTERANQKKRLPKPLAASTSRNLSAEFHRRYVARHPT